MNKIVFAILSAICVIAGSNSVYAGAGHDLWLRYVLVEPQVKE
jgi:hypothetical protein